MLQPFQAYSKLYHKSKLKAIIDEKFKEYQQNTEGEQKSRFAFATSLTKQMLDNESEEVKQEVEAYRKQLLEDNKIKLEDDDENEGLVDDEAQLRMNQKMQT